MNVHTQPISRLIIHHSASPLSTNVDDIRRWHVDDNGWDAIGYHFVVTGLGLVERTRELRFQGAHARGFNDGSIGVCLIGNNTEESNRWRREQVYALQRLGISLRHVFGDLEITGHRDLASGTECPGVDVRPMLMGPRFNEWG